MQVSFSDDLLTIMSGYSGGYRLIRARLRGYRGPISGQKKIHRTISDDTLSVTLHRLKKRGLLQLDGKTWRIARKGKEHLSKIFPRRSWDRLAGPKRVVIVFDIPERAKKKRDWLRTELRVLGFSMLQQSVWFGPAPLPREFIEALDLLGLATHIRFFEAREADIV